MRRPAKILLAGTLAAILPCGAATSQTLGSVYNDQVQTGDVFSDQTLDVVEATDGVSANTTAAGNSASFSADAGGMDVRSYQTLPANVGARTWLDVGANAGTSSALSTAAVGNSGEAGVAGGVHTGIYNQRTEATTVSALGHVEAPDAQAGDLVSSVQANGNSQSVWASGGATGVAVNQENNARVDADGGGVIRYVSGQADFTATSVANNTTVAGESSGQRVVVNQVNNAEVTQAAQFTSFGNAQSANTQAAASGNSLIASEQGPILDVASNQANQAYVHAQAVNAAYEYGAGSASANGVGNSMMAGNIGPATVIDNVQINDGGGVEVAASFTGTQGYDATVSSMAVGNSATGYACSDCTSTLSVNNRQSNNADVGARSTVSVASGRSVYGSSSAVGNSASYYVSQPSH